MQDEEFILSFVEESKVHIDTVENELINLNLDDVDMEIINNIFRAVHTIKGTSGFFDFKNIVELSHALENIFGEIRSGNLPINNEMIDHLLKANDCLRVMIDDVANSEDVDISSYVRDLSVFLKGEAVTQTVVETEADTVTEEADASFDVARYLSSSEKQALLLDELRHGGMLYLLKRKLYADLISNDLNVAELLKEIASMGSLIAVNMDLNELLTADEAAENDVTLEVLFTTVLEKDFLPPLLSEPEDQITELFVKLETSQSEPEPCTEAVKEKVVEEVAKPATTPSVIPESIGESVSKDKPKSQMIAAEDSIRVNVTLLNNLLNLSSEMVLARNQLFRRMENHRKEIPGIEGIFQNINHITSNLQETVMQTRMQPVSNVFNKFPRIARELSKKLDKDITLELEGTEVELDKSIVEALGDPLTHLVRNAIDHGMEHPEERIKLEKPRMGTIKLKAYHESGYVNIDVIDDGKGIDTDVIRKKAHEKGFISLTEIDALGEQESLQLLFRPGFSTAEAITDLSGRGVGMDVVKTNIEKLGGKIEIFTNLGRGTTFRLLLPLTLAIIPSLIVEAENQKFALPQINVQEIVRIKANDPLRKIELINHSEVIRLRGRLLPIVHLSDVLKLDKCQDYKMPSIVRILVIKIGARRLGLSVDMIHGSEEILVKTLPSHIKGCNNYSGVTILGDGKVAMILDPSGIIENANLRYIDDRFEAKNKSQLTESEKIMEHQNLLLFNCSGPETLALDMAMVSRVEEIKLEDIEQIGDKAYIKFRGEALRIVRPEDYIDLGKQSYASKGTGKLFVIIPKLVKHPMGILIEKMQDTMEASIKLTENSTVSTKGLVGSTILNDKIVLLLNIYELFEMASPELFASEAPPAANKLVKILLAEDTPFFQKMEKDYLENAGYVVTVADNGKIALQHLQTEHFDIVVSDINMPEMNGLELIKRIRSDSTLCKLPVIAVTSMTGEQQKKEGLNAGFDAYEFKLDRSRLLEVLNQVVQDKGAKS